MTHGRPESVPAALELCGVSRGFGPPGRRNPVLEGVDFALGRGECVAVVGFSGSGKTTLLSILAGLLEPDCGEVRMNGAPAPAAGPERGVVFQSYALLPWLSALANVQLAVDAAQRSLPRAQRRQRALELLRLVGLDAARAKRPGELSGGMRQRVALARALALDPEILLLDEPLGALDALTRASLQVELARIVEHSGKSAVLITNDVDEAILLADRIVPLGLGPGAKLGPSFCVGLDRPRERTALNRDPAFKKLRNEVMAYLLELAARRSAAGRERPRTARPDLEPVDLSPHARRAPR
jgi:nitrate/nitrite transport system ATP-binding protein